MRIKLQKRISLQEYSKQLTDEVLVKEQTYNEKLKIDPGKYIRNEYKILTR
jgi:hypothetical protein